ncbi:14222_t:CDS:2 [Funneliformis caledonium]|uniref:14222_t:CDS:1 n=1 Tax=Funneliformis caledonium TaxID=1117310 RepID=A0A9N8W3D4_9GLOM|nr:14222_t:CDS:2 [Funneliformis caledonium]
MKGGNDTASPHLKKSLNQQILAKGQRRKFGHLKEWKGLELCSMATDIPGRYRSIGTFVDWGSDKCQEDQEPSIEL